MSSVFCFSCSVKTTFFKRKKHAPRFASSICRKIFSSIGWTPEFCVGENFWSFLALVTPKTPWREHLRILVLWRTFLYSSRSIYPESFISFRPAVSEKHRKGGGVPLRSKTAKKHFFSVSLSRIKTGRNRKTSADRVSNGLQNVVDQFVAESGREFLLRERGSL